MVLRDPRPADAAPYAQAFRDDPGLPAALGYDAPSAAEVRRTFRSEARERAAGESIRLVVATRQGDGFLGLVLLHSFRWAHRRADCGVMVVPAARRRGVALEALRLLVGWAFAGLGLRRVGLRTLPENAATQALAERAGFQFEGVLRGFTIERERAVDNVSFAALAGDPAWA